MTSKVDRQIARAIVMAQLSSDSGKGFHWEDGTPTPANSRAANDLGYTLKLPEIIRAIRMINSVKETVWRYYVEQAPDQNGHDSYIVYFETKDESGNRIQISFHNPAWKSQELACWAGKGRKTRWNRCVGGSRDDAKRIVELFNL